jgi:hypothetical protein
VHTTANFLRETSAEVNQEMQVFEALQ